MNNVVKEYDLLEIKGWSTEKLLANIKAAFVEFEAAEGTDLEYESWKFWVDLEHELSSRN